MSVHFVARLLLVVVMIVNHPHPHPGPDRCINIGITTVGGSYGADGCIYGMPSDATSILRIDPIKDEATTFGTVPRSINKWQGGVLSNVDDCFYAVPANMDCVLRVNTRRGDDDDDDDSTSTPSSYLRIDYVGEGCFPDVDDKWQGGFAGRDGRIYAIPENCERVMVITPGDVPSVELL